MNTRKILVTGAAGLIGSAFWKAQANNMDLRLADIDESRLPDSAQRFALDIRDQASCLEACAGIHTVIHLAGDPNPDADFMSSLLPVNIVGTYNMLSAAKAQGCKRFILASSAQAIEVIPRMCRSMKVWRPDQATTMASAKRLAKRSLPCTQTTVT